MEIHHLRYFVAVAESRTIAAAAQRLSMSASPLSRRIRDFEEHMGSPLFNRTAQGFALTAFGNQVLPIARRALGTLGEIEQLRDPLLTQNVFRIGLPIGPASQVSHLLLDALNRSNPGTAAQFQVLDTASAHEQVLAGKLDLATVRTMHHDQQLSSLKLTNEKAFPVINRRYSEHLLTPLPEGSLYNWTGVFGYHPTFSDTLMQFLTHQRVSNIRVVPGADLTELARLLDEPRTFTVHNETPMPPGLIMLAPAVPINIEIRLIWRSDQLGPAGLVDHLTRKLASRANQ